MAQSNILEYLLLGGAAYLAYTWFTSPATSTTVAPQTPTPNAPAATPPAPTVAYTPPSTAQQLQTAAGAGVTMLNADQWSYYWQQLGLVAVDPTKWQAVFFPSGRPPSGTAEPTMTAQAYVTALTPITGLSGYQGYRRAIPVPTLYARGFGRITLGDLRAAGRI